LTHFLEKAKGTQKARKRHAKGTPEMACLFGARCCKLQVESCAICCLQLATCNTWHQSLPRLQCRGQSVRI